ncbi:MAG: hypothetical protein O9324_25120 [Microcystis sp. LE19-84.1B]|nr:hypothetical protein [Microcystis sp. LE19-84.1B]MCZ8227128.1 hypothetical protein [Microcystis sp. LE19-84.1B]
MRLLPSAFGIVLKPTVSINVHGAFPKIDRWSNRSHIRERTLRLYNTFQRNVGPLEGAEPTVSQRVSWR